MSDDAQQAADAIARLTGDQRRLVGACLTAMVRGPYVPNDSEFHSVMGVWREEAAVVAATWPDPAANGLTVRVVNNTLNNLLSFPHGQWDRLRREIDGDERALAQAIMAWRGEDRREGGAKGYFDAMM